MQPARSLKAGDTVKIHVRTESGADATADFSVRDSAP